METRQMEVDGRMVFDHRVEIREPKTGKVVEQKHYILHINKEGIRYESPPHTGKFFNAQGVLVKDLSKEISDRSKEPEPAKVEVKTQSAAEPQVSAEKEIIDPVAAAEAEAAKILSGERNTLRKKV